MPPKPEEMNGDITESPQSARVLSIPRSKSVPFFNLHQQPSLYPSDRSEVSFQEEADELKESFENLTNRVDELLDRLESVTDAPSPVRDACQLSLRTRTPRALNQASGLIGSIADVVGDSDQMIGKMRASLALRRVERYLDTLESCSMNSGEHEKIDEQLLMLLNSDMCKAVSETIQGPLTFGVSPWVSSLAFDLPAGKNVRSSIEGSLPLTVDVEPVVEFRSKDILNGKNLSGSFRPCSVDIEKIKHTSCEFSRAGTVGEAMIKVRLSPLEGFSSSTGAEEVAERLCVREARAVQLNACDESYSPKPKAAVDLYTTYLDNDTSVTLTLVIKTSVTRHGEAPHIHVELLVASIF